MMILSGKYISSNGEVMLPYLEEWKNVRIFILYALTGLDVNRDRQWHQDQRLMMTYSSVWFRVLDTCNTGVTFPLSHQDKCDLVSLLQVMVVMFREFPPVCMQPHSEPEQASCK